VPGLGRRKQQVLKTGGLDFLASAMMETEKMDTNYPYGDNKRDDSFNAGICKVRHLVGTWSYCFTLCLNSKTGFFLGNAGQPGGACVHPISSAWKL
jgi:hypothetical protein